MIQNTESLAVRCFEESACIVLQCSVNGRIVFNVNQRLSHLRDIFKDYNKILSIDFEGLKIFYEWNSSVTISPISKQKYFTNLTIQCSNKTTLENISINSCKVNSRSLYFRGDSKIQNLSFVYKKNFFCEDIDSIMQNQQRDCIMTTGRLRIMSGSKLQANRLTIKSCDLCVQKDANIKMSGEKSLIELIGGNLMIDCFGNVYSQMNLVIIGAEFLENKGYIGTKNKTSLVKIQTKRFRNTGQINIQKLVISCEDFTNEKVGQITCKQGSIMVNGDFQNKGLVTAFQVSVNSEKKIYFTNEKTITVGSINTKCHSFQNKGIVLANRVNIEGNAFQSVMINSGAIFPKYQLQIKKLHFKNCESGKIINEGKIKFDIEAWINHGQMTSESSSSYIKINEFFGNKGVLTFMNGVQIEAENIKNQNKFFSGKKSIIRVDDMFRNEGPFKIQSLKISANSLRNLQEMQVFNNIDIKASLFVNQNILKFNNEANIDAEYFYAKSGSISAGNLHMNAKNFRNDADFNTEVMDYKGQHFNNNKFLKIKKSGNINAKVTFSDSKNAQTILNNVVIEGMDVINLQGDIQMKKVNVKVKDFYNHGRMIMQDQKMNLRGFGANELTMKDTHIGTMNIDIRDKIVSKGGINGLYQGGLPSVLEQNTQLNKFIIHTKTIDFYNKLNIVMTGENQQLVSVSTRKLLNGWTMLERSPVSVGNFHHHLICDTFDPPQNKIYHVKLKNEKPENWNPNYIPKHKQKALTIETKNINYKGKLVYEGDYLKINGGTSRYQCTSIEVPEGILALDSSETLEIVKCYLNAKRLVMTSKNEIKIQASKFVAGLEGIIINAKKIVDVPKVTTKEKTSYSGDEEKTRIWQQAQRSTYLSGGSIIISAEEYVRLIAPFIQAKEKIWINSPNTVIQGIFLLDKTQTKVIKDTKFGGTKTNYYMSRNDKAFEAKLTADQIIFEGNAKVNAKLKANKVYDLTHDGIQMFFVIGYFGDFQNRQFNNFATQGVQGHNITGEKLLKANLKEVAQIIRPQSLPGKMKFNTVEWGKVKTKITGHYEQKIYKSKVWCEYWERESISGTALAVIGIAASAISVGCFSGALVNSLGVANNVVLSSMATATLGFMSSKVAVSLAANKFNLEKCFKDVFSSQTLKAAAFNALCAGVTHGLIDKFKLQGKINIIPRNAVKLGVNTVFGVLKGSKIEDVLLVGVKNFAADIFGEISLGKIGQKLGDQNKDRTLLQNLIHKGLHGVAGAIKGFIRNGTKGAIAQACGAIAGEIAIQNLMDRESIQKRTVQLKLMGMNAQQIKLQILADYQLQIAIANIIGAIAGGITAGDPHSGYAGSSDAINFNFLQGLVTKIGQAILDSQGFDLPKNYDPSIFKQAEQVVKFAQKHGVTIQQAIDLMTHQGLIKFVKHTMIQVKEVAIKVMQINKILVEKFGQQFLKSMDQEQYTKNYLMTDAQIKKFIQQIHLGNQQNALRQLGFIAFNGMIFALKVAAVYYTMPIHFTLGTIDALTSFFKAVSYMEESRKLNMINQYAKHHKIPFEKAQFELQKAGAWTDDFAIMPAHEADPDYQQAKGLIKAYRNCKKGLIPNMKFIKPQQIPSYNAQKCRQLANKHLKDALFGGIKQILKRIPGGDVAANNIQNLKNTFQNVNLLSKK